MKTITTDELTTVTGGTSSSDGVASQLTALQGSIKDLAAAKPAASSTDSMMLPMMMMAMRPQQSAPTVVAAGAPAAPASVVNINTRVRRW